MKGITGPADKPGQEVSVETVTAQDAELYAAQFDFDLPASLWNEHPYGERGDRKLMVLRRAGATIEHHRLEELPALVKGAPVCVNNSKTRPAWIYLFRDGEAFPVFLKRWNGYSNWAIHSPNKNFVAGRYRTKNGSLVLVEELLHGGVHVGYIADLPETPRFGERETAKRTWEIFDGG